MQSVKFLDAVRARHHIPSDNKLAKFLRMDQSRISLYRTGRRRLDPDACIAVARALELPPEYVLASVEAERAKRTEHRRLWERLAELAKGAAAVYVLGFAVFGSGEPNSVAAAPAEAPAGTVYSVKSRARRLAAALAGVVGRRSRRRLWRPASPSALAAAT